jgi:hypothetical protein
MIQVMGKHDNPNLSGNLLVKFDLGRSIMKMMMPHSLLHGVLTT